MMDYNNPNDFWMHPDYDLYNDMSDDERIQSGCMHIFISFIAIVIMMIIMALFSGCKSVEYVFVPQHDTLIITKHLRDSVYLKDSTHVSEKGDTVQIEKWHTKYVEKQVHDTTYTSKTDTVPQPYPVTKEVPAELTWWQQARLHMMNGILLLLLLWLVIWLLRKKIVNFLR